MHGGGVLHTEVVCFVREACESATGPRRPDVPLRERPPDDLASAPQATPRVKAPVLLTGPTFNLSMWVKIFHNIRVWFFSDSDATVGVVFASIWQMLIALTILYIVAIYRSRKRRNS